MPALAQTLAELRVGDKVDLDGPSPKWSLPFAVVETSLSIEDGRLTGEARVCYKSPSGNRYRLEPSESDGIVCSRDPRPEEQGQQRVIGTVEAAEVVGRHSPTTIMDLQSPEDYGLSPMGDRAAGGGD